MNHSAADLDAFRSLRLFVGAATPAECRVYAELDRSTAHLASGEWTLSGRVTGPFCPYAQTLSASHALVDRGPGDTLLAECRVSEACFWTPQFPYLYDFELQLSRDGQEIAQTRRLFGLRWFATAGRQLLCERQPWTLQAVRVAQVELTELAAFHQAGIAVCCRAPDDTLCEAASRQGVLLAAEVDAADPSLANTICRLAQWPAVVFAMLSADAQITPAVRKAAGNLLFVQDATRESPGKPIHVADWAQLVLAAVDPFDLQGVVKLSRDVPVVAFFPGQDLKAPVAAREAIARWYHAAGQSTSSASEEAPWAGVIVDLRGGS